MKKQRSYGMVGILFCILAILMNVNIGKQVWAGLSCPEIKKVALTFDDGPHPIYTKQLLDGLKERGIKATFFVIGEQIEGNETLLKRMVKEGHLIGNHTYHHVDLSKISEEEGFLEIKKTNQKIYDVTGQETCLIRPPFGAWNKSFETHLQMIPVMWDVDTLDWKVKDPSVILERVLEGTQENGIILMHDYYETSVEAVWSIVEELSRRGYQFVTVDQIIMD